MKCLWLQLLKFILAMEIFETSLAYEDQLGLKVSFSLLKAVADTVMVFMHSAQGMDAMAQTATVNVALPFIISQLNDSVREQLGWKKDELFQDCTYEGAECDYE